MARIKKYADNIYPNLTNYQVFITDTNPNSDYFRITEFKDTFTGGKNGFLIEGSEHLLETTEIKIEILDVEKNPIFFEPGDGIPEYYEGISKLISVHVYEDTPIGLARITILGELKTYINAAGDVVDIPDEWKGVYNVKWEKEFKVNRLLSNEDKVRFYKRPKVSIDEVVKSLYSNTISTTTNTGTISGTPLFPLAGTSLSQYKLPTSYLLTITDTGPYSAWTGSVVGNTISVPSIGYETTAEELINKTQLVVTNPYTDVDGIVQSFSNKSYTTTFEYIEGVQDLATALTGSFAKITLTDLTSFVGDVARVKVFRKSQSDLSDYQFIQEIKLEANEILVDLNTTNKNSEYFGLFTTNIISDYWDVSSPNLTTTFNENYLYNSVKLDSLLGINTFSTKNNLSINKDVEYTLSFGLRGENSTGDGYIRAFISGSKIVNSNVVQVEQDFITISPQTAILQKSTINENIKADDLTDAKLYFEVSGSGWYISDVSLKASQETAFSPDEITFIQSVPRTLPAETFLYRFEFYDINNNFIPVLVEKTKTFTGGNLQSLQKRLQLLPSSLYFQFDSGSNPVAPFNININVVKNLLSGSVTFTSKSFDNTGTELLSSEYTSGGYPGLLSDITTDSPFLTVQNFTGSRTDKFVQYIQYTGECEGFTDSVTITRVLDGFGGVNYLIKAYNGNAIRNSSTQSLEIQAVKVDGVNNVDLSSSTISSTIQLHVLSGSKFVNLYYASQSKFIQNIKPGILGTGNVNYNAIFDRQSIDKQLIVYLMPSGSNPVSESILSSIVLSDLQDGLDSGIISFTTDTFTINPRTQTKFTPEYAIATASFYLRGSNTLTATGSVIVYPSMSLDSDFNPHYFLYYTTHSINSTISVSAKDANLFNIKPGTSASYFSVSESKNINISFTYTEPFTNATINRDKTFTIVPEGKPGDETIVYEVTPSSVVLNANAKGVVSNYSPSITDIKLKQGSRYLIFTASNAVGTYYILTGSIVSQNVTPGNIQFTSSFGVPYTASLLVSQSSNFTQLSGSITYPLIIHPYYTSSIYTGSVIQQYTKVLDGAPPIEILVTPNPVQISSGETGTITDYSVANTTIKVKEGSDFLTYNTSGNPGTFNIQSISATNITATNAGVSSQPSASITFSSFTQNVASASVTYNIDVYPFSLGPGHIYTSSRYTATQNFTKNIAASAARSVKLSATSTTINFDSNGVIISPTSGITLTATAYNVSGSAYFRILKDGVEKSGFTIAPLPTRKVSQYTFSDYVNPGSTSTWTAELKDGGTSGPVVATDSLTFTGVNGGADAYSVQLTNDNSSVSYLVQGTTDFGNTGTQINASKGDTPLTHVTTFSPQTQDVNGNDIGSIGEYRVTIFSKSSHITLAGGLVSGSVVPTVSGIAQIGNLTAWSSITTNPSASIVYKVDLENGKQILYKTQSFTVQYEGKTGPGIVFRGPWSSTITYFDTDDNPTRRDAVLYNGTYYATVTNATTNLNKVPSSEPTFWESLGTEEYFVAAKIAIFEESFVKNTLNVGTNTSGSNANIIINGRDTRPYIAVGQGNSPLIGYGNEGIWMGTYYNGSINTPRFSLVNSGDTNHLKWDGSSLDIKGSITVTGGDAATQTYADASSNYSSSLVDAKVFTTTAGLINKAAAPSGAGLYLGSSYMGYYNGSNWKTYMSSSGDFYLSGTSGTQGLTWIASTNTLSIDGQITARSGYFYGNITSTATISGGTISGGTITGGTITGGTINGTSINGGSINGTTGTFTGTVNALSGYFGSGDKYWLIGTNTLENNATSNGKLSLNASRPAIEVYNSSNELKIDINSGTTFSSDSASSLTKTGGITGQDSYSTGNIATGGGGASIYQTNVYRRTSESISISTSGYSGKTVTFSITSAGTAGSSTLSGTNVVGHYLSLTYGYEVREGSTSGTVVATLSATNTVSTGASGTQNLPSYSKTFNVSITANGGSYYFVPFITNINLVGYSSSGTIDSLFAVVYTPTATSANVTGTIPINKTEIIAGGLQVVRGTGQYVLIDATSSNPILQVGGEGTFTGDVTANTSDKRLKEDIRVIDNALEKLKKINGVYFKWNDTAKQIALKDNREEVGFLAQEVNDVLPHIIKPAPFDVDLKTGKSKSGENYLTIQYEKIVPLLVEAIKELKQEIEELKNNR